MFPVDQGAKLDTVCPWRDEKETNKTKFNRGTRKRQSQLHTSRHYTDNTHTADIAVEATQSNFISD